MNKTNNVDKKNFSSYCGYHQTWEGDPISELVEVGPGTACGEYLRRYWHPVFIAGELEDRPKLIKVLGEELVIFRDRSGQYGLVHKKCPHRRASMEFGRCEDRGISCCYHGWKFDVDGTVLDIPGEPEDSRAIESVKSNVRLGAYPVKEYKGILFAYLGPMDELPEFPIYDSFNTPGITMSPCSAIFNCNWIQVLDAIVDPVHTAFLHQSQFSDGFGKMGELAFYHRQDVRFLGSHTRRVGDNIWVRVNELILPNFTQSGSAFAADGTEEKLFGRSAFTRWVVPVDDEKTIAFFWGNFGERGDPHEYNTPEGMQLIEQGELINRTYEEKQASPGDVEAVEGMGKISDHSRERLVSGDRGVGMYRNQMKKLIRNLQDGHLPPKVTDLAAGAIPTYGSDTVLTVPDTDETKGREMLKQTNDQVMDIIFAGDELSGEQRDNNIIENLQALSKSTA